VIGRTALALAAGFGFALGLATYTGSAQVPATTRLSYAVYGEYARTANKLMKNGLNRRVFNKVEAQSGNDITLNADGSITLLPGTYRITGSSTVTMQTSFAPPAINNNNNYPGYSIVYPVSLEQSGLATVEQAIAIGTPNTASYLAPSVFEAVYTALLTTNIAVGHQSGNDLHGEVYLSIYDVDGAKSDYHAVARVAITRLDR
jgi:hypothetical protein